jgi:hypothetical protein
MGVILREALFALPQLKFKPSDILIFSPIFALPGALGTTLSIIRSGGCNRPETPATNLL